MKTLSPFAGFCITFNILTATGPISIPYPFYKAGIALSIFFILLLCILSFLTVTYIAEVMAFENAKINDKERREAGLESSSQEELSDRSDEINPHHPINKKDTSPLESNIPLLGRGSIEEPKGVFVLRHKVEYGQLTEELLPRYGHYLFLFALIAYAYGALCIKTVAAAESLTETLSYAIYENKSALKHHMPFDPYGLMILAFALPTFFFSVKNVQDSKLLQAVIAVSRIATIICLLIGSMYALGEYGPVPDDDIRVFKFSAFPELFGNVIFAFMYHHSVPGILTPIRPSRKVYPMLFGATTLTAAVFILESMLAVFAFGGRQGNCDHFPCAIQPLYNENYLAIQGLNFIVNFYPVLNLAPFPVVAITLRNNLMQLIIPDTATHHMNNLTKTTFMFACLSCIPVYIVAFFVRNVQQMLAYTGGYSGMALMYIFPCWLIIVHRKRLQSFNFTEANPFRSPISDRRLPYVLLVLSAIFVVILTYNLAR